MKHYQEITLLPSEEVPGHFLWEKIFQQVHLALVERKSSRLVSRNGRDETVDYSEYGVSFPQYEQNLNALGIKLRVFAPTRDKLELLCLSKWLERLQDYCRCGPIETVPEDVEYVRFQRQRFVSNRERLARRRAKRKGESYEDALAYFSSLNEQSTRLPFIYLDSLSGKQRFPLFIDMKKAESVVEGEFSCYGLSKTATVPWFD